LPTTPCNRLPPSRRVATRLSPFAIPLIDNGNMTMTTLLRDFGRLVLSGLVSLPLLIGPVAQAAPITFDLLWDGSPFGNTASALGSITLDRTTLPNPGFRLDTLANFGVTALSVTVSGASSGNGTFGIVDFDRLIWRAGPPVDFTTELVGQAGFQDFNLFSAPFSGVPTGFGDDFITDSRRGDAMRLTSMIAATPSETPVPVPATLALFGLGLLGLGLRRRQRCVG